MSNIKSNTKAWAIADTKHLSSIYQSFLFRFFIYISPFLLQKQARMGLHDLNHAWQGVLTHPCLQNCLSSNIYTLESSVSIYEVY
jgi:hypothetical protein